MTRVISAIAIDLGARYTGLYSTQYMEGEVPCSANAQAATLVLPEEGGKMTWSQQGRTATRHRLRSNKRRKFAKRLLKLCIQATLDSSAIDLTDDTWARTWEGLSGLLNRRGFNRVQVEVDLSELAGVEPDWFARTFPDYFVTSVDLASQWELLAQNPERLRELQADKTFGQSTTELKKLMVDMDAVEKSAHASIMTLLKSAVSSILDDLDYGHKHRLDYLQDIQAQISRDSRFHCLEAAITKDELWRLVGNVSNLQLRALRWYFNDKSMAKGDRWDEKALEKVLMRWIDYWRPQGDKIEIEKSRRHQREFKQALVSAGSALVFLKSFPPECSIPPYEDQDNRRPPKDQTLWLSPVSMNNQFGSEWRRWAKSLRQANPECNEGIADALAGYDRKSRLPKTVNDNRVMPAYSDSELEDTYFLQRILDRNRYLDPYALRALARNLRPKDTETAFKRLRDDLGSEYANSFLSFAEAYYSEWELARQGVWSRHSNSLLERSDLNPPHKSKLLNVLVGNIIQQKLDEDELATFLENLWTKRVVGKSTLRGAAKSIEECRKQHGNLFNEKLRRMRYQKELLHEEKPKWDKEQKEIWKVYEKALLASGVIAEYFRHEHTRAEKYANPYSIAQLYTILETDRKGFSRTTRAAHLENNWRMGEVTLASGKVIARCSRLPADSVRPFDGVLKRVLERSAAEIARFKSEQIRSLESRGLELEVPILVEENRFAFSESLLDLKKASPKRRKALSERLSQQSTRWQTKHERITAASRGICPYLGVAIGSNGERDHILPQSSSLSQSGTVYNSEANLIYCSRDGNQRKGNKRYGLADLHANYLRTLFGTDDSNEVRLQIERKVEALPNGFIFDALSPDDQNAVRHSLFLADDSSARARVVTHLAKQNASRVNGTQAWLARRVVELLSDDLSAWAESRGHSLRFSVYRIDAQSTSETRVLLGEYDSKFVKPSPQGVSSHAIDAMCVYAAAGSVQRVADKLAIGSIFQEDMHVLSEAFPGALEIRRIERKSRAEKSDISSQPIFKEGIYAEHFLPLWVDEKVVRVGWEKSTGLVVEGSKPRLLVEVLAPCIKGGDAAVAAALTAEHSVRLEIDRQLAFEYLRRSAKEPLTDVELCLTAMLEGLYYSTSKKEVQKRLYDAARKSFRSADEILDERDFRVNVQLAIGRGKKASVSLKGNLLLPARNDWHALLAVPEIGELLGQKTPEPANMRRIYEKHFNAGSRVKHSPVRRVFSLPIVDAPSGGFRIRRKGQAGDIWQLHAIEGSPAVGFAVDSNRKIQWDTTVLHPSLLDSGNIVGKRARYQHDAGEILAFGKWLPIEVPLPAEIIRLEMAPGTKDRRYIRLTQSFASLRKWLLSASKEAIAGPLDLPAEIKVTPAVFAKEHGITLLGKPRSNLFVETVGSFVTYWYIVESSNAAMKTAYQEAYNKISG